VSERIVLLSLIGRAAEGMGIPMGMRTMMYRHGSVCIIIFVHQTVLQCCIVHTRYTDGIDL